MTQKLSKAVKRKQEAKDHLVSLIKEYPIIGVADLENLPAAQLNTMRKKLRSNMKLFMTKKTVMKRAIDETSKDKKGLEKLKEQLNGMPAILFTKDNPFKISKIVRQNKSKAPAKPGQIAPEDVIVKAGPTEFPPGPIISDLGSIGLKTGVENGKIAIKEDKTVLKAGETFTEKETSVLAKLGIEPMEIGLNLQAVLENGTIYGREVLSIDDKEYIANLKTAINSATNLSVFIGYPTKENIKLLITKAYLNTKHLSELSDDKSNSPESKPDETTEEKTVEEKPEPASETPAEPEVKVEEKPQDADNKQEQPEEK